jgi:hypothetical protein
MAETPPFLTETPKLISAAPPFAEVRRGLGSRLAFGQPPTPAGLELTERATIDVGLLDPLHRPYREQTINREYGVSLQGGTPRANAGSVRRQPLCHASLFADPGQKTYDQLDALGSRLKLPSGWRYATTTPDQDSCSAHKAGRPSFRTSSTTPIRSSFEALRLL